jgi:hypothetical protein
MFGKNMSFVFQMKQSPIIAITAQNDASAITSIATVGAPFGDVLFAPEMSRSAPAFSRTAKNLDIVNKIGFGHDYIIGQMNQSLSPSRQRYHRWSLRRIFRAFALPSIKFSIAVLVNTSPRSIVSRVCF